jgi:hypothetical protein
MVNVLLLLGMEHRRGTTFCFLVYFFIFWLDAFVLLLGYCVVVEAMCNWYLLDINIFLLLKNVLVGSPRVLFEFVL